MNLYIRGHCSSFSIVANMLHLLLLTVSFCIASLVLGSPIPQYENPPISFSTTTVSPLVDIHRNMSSVCESMIPTHGPAHPQKSTAPYKVTVSTARVAPQGTLSVTLSGRDDQEWRGVYLQARDNDGVPVGQFVSADDPHVILSSCGAGSNNAASYISHNPIKSFSFQWTAPEEPSTVTFYVTFVENYSTFWVRVPSEAITVSN